MDKSLGFGFPKNEIDLILNQEDLVLRNLQITLGYYRIAQGLSRVVGDQDVNWFCFGSYASKTAGQALRHELFPRQFKRVLLQAAGYDNIDDYYRSVLWKVAEDPDTEENMVAEVLSDVSLSVSEGNYMIFSELAWPFSVFIETFSTHRQPDWQELEAFLDQFIDPGPVENGGQAYLREAFSAFYSARFETDAKKKAEWVLLGNLMTGLHEQTRIQPVIERALAAPFNVIAEEFNPADEQPDTLIEESGKRLLDSSRLIVLKAITHMWMTYALPGNEIRLGQDVRLPQACEFPDGLVTLDNPRTLAIVSKFDRDLTSLRGSAAENWASLDDRMTFLADFFRSHQRYQPLFAPPFSGQQVKAILAGQIPNGPL
ncbi:MAG: hypothetical protein JW757_11150 [Anaerolineales bacterium]|nr:hypothetical protein [Anaerolineales bacterium]